ncbi:hypothetical protein SAMD00019534_026950 [Acytostelium subglobosum LB1]|uniref:hypothetical protein n=1 Tax=Acytostelium subglobosum LB1 TaxID=1410327 RepID=UPI0006451D41|nr:hypothetical protein SAMD00019534_026950 [Acytostelium subglobosum LB1]GAM19520.1 hypothetical protein SAMD00019534_026950 [Acytostelium subglobosum LB1]|eukprot:XP_012757447.1 hypothetical protein SAMD00019534_026950 [Acytostelium subglobosum LB1]
MTLYDRLDDSNSNSNSNNIDNNELEDTSTSGDVPIIPGYGVATVDLFWSGGTYFACSFCNSTLNVTYACSYDDMGHWNNGINHFLDPMPKDAVLQAVGFNLYGTFNCHADMQNAVVQMMIQNENFGPPTTIAYTAPLCQCMRCLTVQPMPITNVTHPNLYNVSGINQLTTNVITNGVCLYKVQVLLYYTMKKSGGFNDLSTKQWAIISGSIVGGMLLIIVTFVIVKRKIGRMGYQKIKEGKNIDIGEVKLGERIGKGNFGEVYKGYWRGAVVAVKKLPAHNITEVVMKEFHREIELMKNLRHPNVLQFLGSCTIPPNICICTEYMPRGSLYSILHDAKVVLQWTLIRKMCLDAVKGVIYLHNSNPIILHRDLKSHNLLVDDNWKVKVADFGLSTIEQTATMTACGTPCWTAPEVLRNQRYTEKADVYSFAIVMWECATRMDPYAGMPPFQVIFAVGREGLRPPLPKQCPPEFVKLITECWEENPLMRPSMENIMQRLEMMDLSGGGGITCHFHTNNYLFEKDDDDKHWGRNNGNINNKHYLLDH